MRHSEECMYEQLAKVIHNSGINMNHCMNVEGNIDIWLLSLALHEKAGFPASFLTDIKAIFSHE